MDGMTTTRRGFVSGAAALGLSLKYGCSSDTSEQAPTQIYRGWEDLMRNKWTWDRVARGTHGTNCTGNCAFNVYVKNGIVWREEQQGEYGFSGDDTPDYGPPRVPERPQAREVHVRQAAPALPDEARRRARRRQVGAHQLGPGDGGDCRQVHRLHGGVRPFIDYPGRRHAGGHEADGFLRRCSVRSRRPASSSRRPLPVSATCRPASI